MKLKNKLLTGLVMASLAMPSINALNCRQYSWGHSDTRRALSSLTLVEVSNASNSQTYAIGQSSTSGSSCNIDKTDLDPIVVAPGTELKFSNIDWPGEWMHSYFYIDYDKDGDYDSVLNRNGDGEGELVSYSAYSENETVWRNSAGQTVTNNRGVNAEDMPSFTIPTEIPNGDYTCLFKIDWNYLGSCGRGAGEGNDIGGNGGVLCEFKIRVYDPAAKEVTISANKDVRGTVVFDKYPNHGTTVAIANAALAITAIPNSGYHFVEWKKVGDEEVEETLHTNDAANASHTTNDEAAAWVAHFAFDEEPAIELPTVSVAQAPDGSTATVKASDVTGTNLNEESIAVSYKVGEESDQYTDMTLTDGVYSADINLEDYEPGVHIVYVKVAANDIEGEAVEPQELEAGTFTVEEEEEEPSGPNPIEGRWLLTGYSVLDKTGQTGPDAEEIYLTATVNGTITFTSMTSTVTLPKITFTAVDDPTFTFDAGYDEATKTVRFAVNNLEQAEGSSTYDRMSAFYTTTSGGGTQSTLGFADLSGPFDENEGTITMTKYAFMPGSNPTLNLPTTASWGLGTAHYSDADRRTLESVSNAYVVESLEKADIAGPEALYIIGANINGQEVTTTGDDNKLTEADGVYSIDLDQLGKTFKITDGDETSDYNYGSNGEKLTLNEPYTAATGSSAGHVAIDIDDNDYLTGAKVSLNLAEGTLTVTGTTVIDVLGVATEVTVIDIYDLSGRTVGTKVTEGVLNTLKPGVYVVRNGSEVKKVLVK